jgi:mannose-6-phosphate isomerase-like protein (cupin superfamily)
MKTIKGENIRSALTKQIRIYLCGNLSKPEDVEFVPTDGLEIGISHYDTFTAEKAHLHQWNHEYNFVKSGTAKVYLLDEQKEYELHQDDMYVIEPNMPYIIKAQPGTEIIFVKSPGGNDKQLLPHSDAIQHWSEDWEAEMKTL